MKGESRGMLIKTQRWQFPALLIEIITRENEWSKKVVEEISTGNLKDKTIEKDLYDHAPSRCPSQNFNLSRLL